MLEKAEPSGLGQCRKSVGDAQFQHDDIEHGRDFTIRQFHFNTYLRIGLALRTLSKAFQFSTCKGQQPPVFAEIHFQGPLIRIVCAAATVRETTP